MIEIQNMKFVQLVPPQLKDAGAFTGNTYVDCAGWGHVRFLMNIGTLDIAVGSTDSSTPPLIEECDTAGGSYTAVTGAALAAVIGAGDDDLLKAIDVDLAKSHKRYMRIQAPTAGDGSVGANMSAIAILSKPSGNGPANAAGMGLDELVTA